MNANAPDEDVEFLDAYAASQSIAPRSAVLHNTVRLLTASELGPDYESASAEWATSEDSHFWELTLKDGIN